MAFLAVACLGLDADRVHLIDSYPRGAPTNFLFRGNNPVPKQKSFNLTELVSVLRQKARTECGADLPPSFFLHDLDLENPTDPGFFVETAFWRAHPSLGQLGTPGLPHVWMTLGSILEPKYTPDRDQLIQNGSWAVQGHADFLNERLNATRALLHDTSGPPKVLYVHCNAGCDRTGEFIGAYALRYLGYNITTAYGEACKQCGRCPNYYATSALGWWCLALERHEAKEGRVGNTSVGDCLNFAGCKFLGDCDAHNPTPRHTACPQ